MTRAWPPRSTYWSIWSSALSSSPTGWTIISTSMSLGIGLSGETVLTSNALLTSFMIGHGGIMPVRMLNVPLIGIPAIRPTTFFLLPRLWTSRVRSYSMKRARLGWKKAIFFSSSTLLVPARPK